MIQHKVKCLECNKDDITLTAYCLVQQANSDFDGINSLSIAPVQLSGNRL